MKKISIIVIVTLISAGILCEMLRSHLQSKTDSSRSPVIESANDVDISNQTITLMLAIPDISWRRYLLDYGANIYPSLHSVPSTRKVLKEYPIFGSFFYPKLGTHRSSSVSKWAHSEIQVGINFFSQTQSIVGHQTIGSKLSYDAQDNIKLMIEEVSDQINSETTKFHFVSEYTGRGGIQIVFTDQANFIEGTKKIDRYRDPSEPLSTMYFHKDFEPLLASAIPFSPRSPRKIDGYLLVDNANHIRWAVCYIKQNLRPKALFFDISECLIRSLGLTNSLTFASGNSILEDNFHY